MHRFSRLFAPGIFSLAILLVCCNPAAKALDIVFDYGIDEAGSNFFGSSGSLQRQALEEAASFFETTFVDDLDAITPGGGNSWSAVFIDPTNSSSNISRNNLSIAADTMVIYVGAQTRATTNLAEAAPGSYSVSFVDTDFLDAVRTRGETGMTPGSANDDTDFGVWGGSISFNDAITWNFDTSIDPTSDEYDFYSTALHEIGHVFGFGIAESFEVQVNGSEEFTGTNVVAANGGDLVQLTSDYHVEVPISSVEFGGSVSQTPLFAAEIDKGSRTVFTDLDVSFLEDVGYESVPEPGSALLVFGGCGALLLRRRRRKVSAE